MAKVKHSFRWSKPGKTTPIETKTETITPMQAIRYFCQECYSFCDNLTEEIKSCPSFTCALYPFRLGRVKTGRKLSQEQKDKLILSLENARTKRRGRKRKEAPCLQSVSLSTKDK